MNCPQDITKPLSYWVVIYGCILALASSLALEPTGAYRLSTTFLITGLVPYIVYGSLTDILQGCSLVTAGLVMLAADLTVTGHSRTEIPGDCREIRQKFCTSPDTPVVNKVHVTP